MEMIKSLLKTSKGLLVISIIISLTIGFFAGMEYKSYQIRTALEDAAKGIADIFGGENETGITQEQEQEKEKTISDLTKKISVELIQKSYVKGDYEDFITMKFRLTNKTDKDMKGVQGTVIFYDIFDSEIYRTKLSYDDGIPKNDSKIWTGTIDYNQFFDEHVKLKNTELENLRCEWEPSVIIYQDGSKEPE